MGTLAVGLGFFPLDNETYLPLSDSHLLRVYGIRSLIGFGKLCGPLAHSVLYLHISFDEASPKAISGRTSYIRVRLEFLRYPHLIRRLFNGGRFGPP